jgi:cell division protease FtsH
MPDPDDTKKTDDRAKMPLRTRPNVWIMVLLLIGLGVLIYVTNQPEVSKVTYLVMIDQLNADNVLWVKIGEQRVTGEFREPPVKKERNEEGELVTVEDKDGEPKRYSRKFWYIAPHPDSDDAKTIERLLAEKKVDREKVEESNSAVIFTMVLYLLLPIALIVFLWFMFRRTRDQIMGGGFLSGFSKSTAERYEPSKHPVTFDDVAGLDNVKQDLLEIIEFLKNPKKFQRLGGQVPKGVLLLGPPGAGKTLLARAAAGEAGVPFYSVNGSEFIQMFVGVGASRVRDLFKTAKDNSPSIVFIDEIDAVGRQRGAGLGGGHDEREQTLNQILSAMDGFSPNEAVIVVGATNRPDVLDPALLRPGRFDRHIVVDRPTLRGRKEIFKVHVRDVPLADDVDLDRLAAGTVGLTGADIRNLVNEAALWATRKDKTKVDMDDFEYARDKVLMGARREDILLEKEKEKTAIHEAGHAVIAWLLPGVDRVHKVTVIPRGRSLGVTQTLPEEDKMNIAEGELKQRLTFLLGGRAAEKLVFNEFSAGAENDLERATQLARRMVTQWGMSERLGPVNYKITDEDPFLGREMHEQRKFSEHMLQVIDEEIANILHDAAERAYQLLSENREKLSRLAKALVEQEEVTDKEITELIGPSVHDLETASGAGQGQLAAKTTLDEQDV